MLETILLFVLVVLSILTGVTVAVFLTQRDNNRTLRNIEAILRVAYKLGPDDRPPTSTTWPIKAVLVWLVVATTSLGSSPARAVAAARNDLDSVPIKDRKYVRYLSAYNYRDAKLLAELKQISDAWVNSLSRNRTIYRLHQVAPDLWRLDLRNYAIPPEVWEKLTDSEIYFHRDFSVDKIPEGKPIVEAKEVEYEWKTVWWEGGIWPGDGKFYPKYDFQYQKKVPKEKLSSSELVPPTAKEVVGGASWVDAKLYKDLTVQCATQTPIVRADWFMVQTSQQDERDGTGYYDFMQIKNRNDVDRLALLDRKVVDRELEEVRAIIPISNVAINGRQVARLATIRGGMWVTLDTTRQARRKDNFQRNVKRNLRNELIHDAEEIYFFLPNRMFGFFAGDAKGVRQDSVPPNVASAGTSSTGNDARIHPYTCIKCHREGIRPLADWGRRVYRAGRLELVSPDYKKSEENQLLYLSGLDKWIKTDQEQYAEALWNASGLKPLEFADLFSKHHSLYVLGPTGKGFGLDEVVVELGVTKARFIEMTKVVALELKLKQGRGLDPSINSLLLVDPEERITRLDIEELFASMMDTVQGIVPVAEPYKDLRTKDKKK